MACSDFARLFHIADTANRVIDLSITGTPAEAAAKVVIQVPLLLGRHGCRSHDHSRCAETTLESGSIHELLLHWMQLFTICQSFKRCHLTVLGARGRSDAAVDRNPVDVDRAGTAVTHVTAFFNAEKTLLT